MHFDVGLLTQKVPPLYELVYLEKYIIKVAVLTNL